MLPITAPKEKPHGATNTEGPTDNNTPILQAPSTSGKEFSAPLPEDLAPCDQAPEIYNITAIGMVRVRPGLVDGEAAQIGGAA